MGLEPMISRTTIWRANQLHHTHHILLIEPSFVQLSITVLNFVVQTSLGGFEPSTYGLEGRCSIQLSYRLIFLTTPKTNCFRKAGDGNRTHVSSLEGWCSTIELHPHDVSGWQDSNLRPPGPKPGALAKLSHTPMVLFCITFCYRSVTQDILYMSAN